jgi:hypothetical protein
MERYSASYAPSSHAHPRRGVYRAALPSHGAQRHVLAVDSNIRQDASHAVYLRYLVSFDFAYYLPDADTVFVGCVLTHTTYVRGFISS